MEDYDLIKEIVLSPPELQIKVGENYTLGVAVQPESAVEAIEWLSSNEKIAVVKHGIVTSVSTGETLITAKSRLATCSCRLTVTRPEVTLFAFESDRVVIEAGKTGLLKLRTEPFDIPLDWVDWESSNERVVRVRHGEIAGIGYGNALVTAKYGSQKAVCELVVTESVRSYQLIWSDEFDEKSINTSYWNFNIGGAGWGNQERQYYTDREKNAYIENGCLVIEALKENHLGSEYTSARLTTKDNVSFAYGKIEARISLPAGKGTWPAFWLMPNDNVYGHTWPRSGEIDIMEHIGSQPSMVIHAVHTLEASGNACWDYRGKVDYEVENDFHIYTLEWIDDYFNGNDALIFSIDGVQRAIKHQADYIGSTFADWPFDQNFYIIFNLAIGGTLGGDVDDTIFNQPVKMKVDWVRVYQIDSSLRLE